MTDRTEAPTEESDAETRRESLEATGVYETGGGIVLYDTEEPLAWVQADNAVELGEMC